MNPNCRGSMPFRVDANIFTEPLQERVLPLPERTTKYSGHSKVALPADKPREQCRSDRMQRVDTTADLVSVIEFCSGSWLDLQGCIEQCARRNQFLRTRGQLLDCTSLDGDPGLLLDLRE